MKEKEFYWAKGNLKTKNYLARVNYNHYILVWDWRVFFKNGQDPRIEGNEKNEEDAKAMAVAAIKARIVTVGAAKHQRALEHRCPFCTVHVGEPCVTVGAQMVPTKTHHARFNVLASRTRVMIEDG